MSIRTRVFAVSALLGLLTFGGPSGCATAADGMQEKLYETTRAYNRSLRWADYDRAAAYVPPEAEDAFLDDHGKFEEELVMIDYNLTRLKMEKQQGIATCRVKLSWHTDRSNVIRDTEVEQVWQFFEGQWFLVDERRVNGEPLALFAELGEDQELEHPYLPGLLEFRDKRDIGISEKEQKQRDRERRRARRRAGDPQAADIPLGGEKHQLPTQQHASDL